MRLLLLVNLLLLSLSLQAQTSVWKISKAGQYFYLAGTMHVLKREDYPLPEAFNTAYEDADQLLFEVDLTELDGKKFQRDVMALGKYADGENLFTLLNHKAAEALRDYCARRGIPVSAFTDMPVGMVVTSISMTELMRLGIGHEGVDAHYMQRAIQDDKAIQGLESLEQQIEFLAAMGKGNESEFLLQNLAEITDFEAQIDVLRKAWREGDVASIERLLIVDMQKQYPDVYQSLLKQRNINWLPSLIKLVKDKDVEYVLVGAAHLAGIDGLLTLLQQQGFEVRQL